MTIRAVTIGLLAGVAIAALAYLNDFILKLYWLVSHQLPVSVYGLVILLVLVGNPVLSLMDHRWGFRRSELAVMVSLALVGGALAGAGLFRNFPNMVITPLQFRSEVPYRNVLSSVPASMLPDAPEGEAHNRAIGTLVGGMGAAGGGSVSMTDLPLGAWVRPLRFWWPLLGMLLLAMVCLALVLHPQWSQHELLRYPIAQFASTLIDTDGRRWPPVFRRPSFWIAVAAVVFVHVVNGWATWHPGMVKVPMGLNFGGLNERWPWLGKSVGGWILMSPTLYVSAAAFVLFMRSDVGLSLGISAGLMSLVSAAAIGMGWTEWGTREGGGYLAWMSFGSYLGFALMIVYIGRHYYARLLRRAVLPTHPDRRGLPEYSVWALRVMLVCLAGAVALLAWAGCPWTMALLFVGLLTTLMLVVGRVSAEAGLMHVGIIWAPIAVVIGLVGSGAAGASALLVAGMVGAILAQDPRTTMLSFSLNSLKLCQQSDAPVGRTGRWMAVALLLALPLGTLAVLWTQYNYGRGIDEWSTAVLPRTVFGVVDNEVASLRYSDKLEASMSHSALDRLWNADPPRTFLWAAGIGAALVLLTGAARLRWQWWPIHPVLFVVWGTWAIQKLAPSLLLGWLVRTAVVRLGGPRKLQDAQVIAVGAIAGDLLGTLIFIIAGMVHYARTGTVPPMYNPYTG